MKRKGPALGIWWDFGEGGLPHAQVPLAKSKDHSGYRDSGKLHANEWKKIQKAFPGLMGMQYIDIPRGRVVHSKGRFIVQMGHQSVKKDPLREIIAKVFRLPKDVTDFVHDLEYDLRRYIPFPFSRWLPNQRKRMDQVGFIARLLIDHEYYAQVGALLADPDQLEFEFRKSRGKLGNAVREALEEWRKGQPIRNRR